MSEQWQMGGTDGVRGEYTPNPGPDEVDEAMFDALSYTLLEQVNRAPGDLLEVVVGRDTRPSSPSLSAASVSGFRRHEDVVVHDMGIAPTPAIQKVARERTLAATLSVTASHNPAKDNGWKGMVGSEKPSSSLVKVISGRYWENVANGLPDRAPSSRVEDASGWLEWYRDEVVRDITATFGSEPLGGALIVIDGAYGATQKVTPQILRRLGADVIEFACDGSGIINENCGAADLEDMKTSGLAQFLMSRPDITDHPRFLGALANDGDGDRVMGIGVQSSGDKRRLVKIDGNHIMWALAQGEPHIIGTDYTNSGLTNRLEQAGTGFDYVPNGDVNVTNKLRQLQAAGRPVRRGGEFTGHLVDTDWLSSGDGVRMAPWYAAHLIKQGMTFGEAHADLPLWPEAIVSIELAKHVSGAAVDKHPDMLEAKRKAEEMLGDNGRQISRGSGTQPMYRAWVEARTVEARDVALQQLVDTARKVAANL